MRRRVALSRCTVHCRKVYSRPIAPPPPAGPAAPMLTRWGPRCHRGP
ncbi:hypothetical protein AMIS_41000 [Actinoplanes missouriensis 431]|uniref:Uncharacterized protein n=1 Tax=Actinoplanes missouriensis (strain ATCC 14538 / DSM 43046 / CBS 188.64 / JCM 3121 / NBRC 102363 / NCIMB 12654 / NRRL B-3342 / UNCC 431) TaxID=512565 RepID=I0H8I3_ACTM4|nr:hypothetical protein AMIS_41000 [Actinoplanes missouriensis 431]